MESWIVRWKNRRKQGQQAEIKVVRGVSAHLCQIQDQADNQVEEVDQVEEVQEEVSYPQKVRVLEANNQDEADHQVAEEEEDQDAEHQEVEEEGDSREWKWKSKGHHILSQGPISSLSILCRQLRECGWYRIRMGMVVG